MKTYFGFPKITLESISKNVRKLSFPKKIFKISTVVGLGVIYFNRENIIKMIDGAYGRYFEYYHEKNTNFKKLVRESVDIPIEVN